MKARLTLNDKDGGIVKAVIDRFESDFAVVLFGDKEIKVDIPLELLPGGVKEGSWVNVSFELDMDGTKKQGLRFSRLTGHN